ncbi:hypothetical protein JHK82_017501 [Glycine max]|nr:hypothetical protein JHK82_017501 [Glycine max]
MRQQYGLKGNGCTDCLLHCCCESCTLSQEYRELKQRGFDMIIGAGKSKGFKDGLDEDGHAPSSPTEVKHSVEPLNTRRRGEEDDGLIHHDSDSKSPTNCPVSVLCGPDSGTNFTGSSSGGSSSSNNNSSNSGGCCSGNVTEVEVEGDEGLLSAVDQDFVLGYTLPPVLLTWKSLMVDKVQGNAAHRMQAKSVAYHIVSSKEQGRTPYGKKLRIPTCGASGALYTLICCVVGCGWLYSCFYRSKMRQQYGLKGNGCTDCLLHCCCESCTLSQEYRELKQRGFDMIIGAGKSKGFKDGLDEDGHAPSSPTEVKHSVEPLNTRRRGEEDDGLIHHDSDSKSPTNCPVSVLCGPPIRGQISPVAVAAVAVVATTTVPTAAGVVPGTSLRLRWREMRGVVPGR